MGFYGQDEWQVNSRLTSECRTPLGVAPSFCGPTRNPGQLRSGQERNHRQQCALQRTRGGGARIFTVL